MTEELDYRTEADNQRAFAKAFAGDPHVLVPQGGGQRAEGDGHRVGRRARRCRRSSATGDPSERDRAGLPARRVPLLLAGPGGLLHADPHPGNFMLGADGRLCVIDFGAVAQLPDGLPQDATAG